MQIYKYFIAILIMSFSVQFSFAQGCEDPGEGDGINMFGYIQPTYEYKFLGKDFGFTKDVDKSGFYFQRARLGVLGNIPYDFTYYFMMEFSPERGVGINDAFVTYNRFGPYFKVSLGLFKSPFSMEQLHACHKLYTIHRSKVVDELAGPIRDMGIMFLGGTGDKKLFGLKTKNIIGYQFAIMNGEGRNIADNDNRKTYIGRLTLHPFDFISLGTSYRYSNFPAAVASKTEDDYATRTGFDIKLEYKNFIATAEYIKGVDVGSYTTGGGCSGEPLEIHEGSVNRKGYYAMLLYKTPWNFEPVVKYESYDPNLDSDNDIQNSLIVGFNYFFNEWTRLQLNYYYNAEETGQVEHPNDMLLIQVQAIIK